MPFDEAAVANPTEQKNRPYQVALQHFANKWIKAGHDGDPPTEFLGQDDVVQRDVTGRAVWSHLASGTNPGNVGTLNGLQQSVRFPTQYIWFMEQGTLTVNTTPVFQPSPTEPWLLTSAYAHVVTPPSGSNLTFDVLRNGASILGTSKLTITAGSHSGTVTLGAIQHLVAAGDTLSFPTLTVGSSVAGAGLTLQWAYLAVPVAL